MSITRPNTLIPYVTVYLIHYFYNLENKCDRKKLTLESNCSPKKNYWKKKNNFFICA